MKDFFERFESIKDFQDAINSRKVDTFYSCEYSKYAPYDFTGTESYEDADKLLTYGDEKATADLLDYGKKRDITTNRHTLYKSPCGFVPNVPAVLAGRPNNMFNIKMQKYKNSKIFTLCIIASVDSCVQPEEIKKFYKSLLNVVYTLENRGYRFNIYIGKVNKLKASQNHSACFVKIKDSGKHFNVTAAAYPLTNQSFLRRHLFRWLETSGHTQDARYGYLCTPTKNSEIIKHVFNGCNNLIKIETQYMLHETEESIMQYIMK